MMRRVFLLIGLLAPAVAVLLYSAFVTPLDPTLSSVVAALPVILWVPVRSVRKAARR
jgi:hypothetical protein